MGVPISDPVIPVYSNVTGYQHNTSTQLTELFSQQLQMSVCAPYLTVLLYQSQPPSFNSLNDMSHCLGVILKTYGRMYNGFSHWISEWFRRIEVCRWLNFHLRSSGIMAFLPVLNPSLCQVRWQSLIENMIQEYGEEIEFHEVGPSRQISAMIIQIHRPSRGRIKATDSGPKS